MKTHSLADVNSVSTRYCAVEREHQNPLFSRYGSSGRFRRHWAPFSVKNCSFSVVTSP